MSTPVKDLEKELDAKHYDPEDFSFLCWTCNSRAFKDESNGAGGPTNCKCYGNPKTYFDLQKDWPAYKKTLIDAFNKQNAESLKTKLYDEAAVKKAIEDEVSAAGGTSVNTDDYIEILKKFLIRLDAKHNAKFKAKLAKAKDDAKLKSWLDAMGNHIGNADDYLK